MLGGRGQILGAMLVSIWSHRGKPLKIYLRMVVTRPRFERSISQIEMYTITCSYSCKFNLLMYEGESVNRSQTGVKQL
jgi:hypothetical protein